MRGSLTGSGDLCAANQLEGREVAVSMEEALIREELIEDDPEREEVNAVIDLTRHRLLWGHVTELPFKNPCLSALILPPMGFGDPKVDELHVPSIGNENILWGDIAVNELEWSATRVAACVRKIKRFCDLCYDPDCQRRREEEIPSLEVVTQEEEVLSRDKLEGDVILTALLALVNDLSDRGVP